MLRQLGQHRSGGCGVHGDLPQLAMPRAVEFAWFAERGQLFGCAFNAPFLFTDQKHIGIGQAGGHGVKDVVAQFFGLGQKHHGGVKRALG